MIKNWLKILPAICLFVVQFIVAIHIHDTENIITVFEQKCVYCKVATGISNVDIPDIVVIKNPLYLVSNYNNFFAEQFICFNFDCNHDTRASPQA